MLEPPSVLWVKSSAQPKIKRRGHIRYLPPTPFPRMLLCREGGRALDKGPPVSLVRTARLERLGQLAERH